MSSLFRPLYTTSLITTTHLIPSMLKAVYRRRWRIEEAFLGTKRVLDLASYWKASAKGIQLQLYTTLLSYAVLLGLC